jgi:predicted transglutaminase-like cysteine proteinase
MRPVRLLALSLVTITLLARAGAAEDGPPQAVSSAYRPEPRPSLFGTREVYSPDTSPFVKWNSMLARFSVAQRCAGAAPESCVPAEWRTLVERARTLDFRAKLDYVNATINRYPYVSSMRNWGESNRWETPLEFIRNGGQCQDYAIAKYLALRAAGMPADRLRVVVLRDTWLELDHAVTVVYTDGEALMLDNQRRDIVSVASVDHYQPYYSISEQGWWLHRGPNAGYAAASENGSVN